MSTGLEGGIVKTGEVFGEARMSYNCALGADLFLQPSHTGQAGAAEGRRSWSEFREAQDCGKGG